MLPIVSVIVPNYNHARYLSKRIESVLNQTFRDIEVILLDDCSSDGSRVIIADYAARDSRIRVVFNEQNSGSTFKQWNKGIALAKGEYIWLAESDDYAHPNFLAELLPQMNADPAVGLAYCDSLSIDEHDTIIEDLKDKFKLEWKTDKWQHEFNQDGKEFIRQFLAHVNMIPNASAVLLRSETLRSVGMADENTRLAGDWLYWLRILFQSRIFYSPHPYNYFRTHTNNVRSKTVANGILLEELLKVLLIVKQLVGTSRRHSNRVERLTEQWFLSFVYGQTPLHRHHSIAGIINQLYGDRGITVLKRFTHFLTKRRFSGFRILVGDGILYKVVGRFKK